MLHERQDALDQLAALLTQASAGPGASRSSAERPASARPRCCANSRATRRPPLPNCCGVPATQCSRRARSGPCRTWPRRSAAGSWQRWREIEAGDLAMRVLAECPEPRMSRILAQLVLGRLRARRGDTGARDAFDEALALARMSEQLIYIGPACAARAEAAWLEGDRERCVNEARTAYDLALQHRHPWHVGEFAYWRRCAGEALDVPGYVAAPYALQLAGQWREAAAAWRALACPYEQARALADADQPAQREALAIFERLGARPAADTVRQLLHDAGVRGLARGPRAATRQRPFGLTAREWQVLELLCSGLRNAEIAARLHRSVRTVDHHLEAVFAKLGVDSRVAAIQAAQRAGLAAQSGQSPTPK